MENPLKVSLENIIPLTEARDHFSQIVAEVQKDKLYVLTKGGKPAVAIVDVRYLEHITGGTLDKNAVAQEIKKAPEKAGLAPMIEHKEPAKDEPIMPSPPPAMPTPPAPPSAGPSSSFDAGGIPALSSATPAPAKPAPQTPPPPIPPVSPTKPNTPAPGSSIPPAPSPAPGTNAPLKTPSMEEVDKINVQFYPDKTENTNHLSADDQKPPAQYDGEPDKIDDMKID